jgi:hypothetical protein
MSGPTPPRSTTPPLYRDNGCGGVAPRPPSLSPRRRCKGLAGCGGVSGVRPLGAPTHALTANRLQCLSWGDNSFEQAMEGGSERELARQSSPRLDLERSVDSTTRLALRWKW